MTAFLYFWARMPDTWKNTGGSPHLLPDKGWIEEKKSPLEFLKSTASATAKKPQSGNQEELKNYTRIALVESELA